MTNTKEHFNSKILHRRPISYWWGNLLMSNYLAVWGQHFSLQLLTHIIWSLQSSFEVIVLSEKGRKEISSKYWADAVVIRTKYLNKPLQKKYFQTHKCSPSRSTYKKILGHISQKLKGKKSARKPFGISRISDYSYKWYDLHLGHKYRQAYNLIKLTPQTAPYFTSL